MFSWQEGWGGCCACWIETYFEMLTMPLDTFLFDVFVARYLYYSACFVVFSLRLGPDVDPLTTFCPAATCYCRDAFANQLASADPHTSGNQARYQKNVIVVFFCFSVGSCDVYDFYPAVIVRYCGAFKWNISHTESDPSPWSICPIRSPPITRSSFRQFPK